MQVSKPLAPPSLLPSPAVAADVAEVIPEEADEDAAAAAVAGNNFSFASSATSQLVLERIMSQSVSFLPLPLFCLILIFFKNLKIRISEVEISQKTLQTEHFVLLFSKNLIFLFFLSKNIFFKGTISP